MCNEEYDISEYKYHTNQIFIKKKYGSIEICYFH